MTEDFFENLRRLHKMEMESAEQNSRLLQDMMDMGVQDINKLDRIADRLMDTMLGVSGAGEEMYLKYLDYIESFNPEEGHRRKDDLEYELGYKTHVLYAAALLCQKEMEECVNKKGQSSFEVVIKEYIPKVYEVKKKTASFLFFAHLASHCPMHELLKKLQTITEDTDFVLEHVDEFDSLMHYPREEYHPLRDEEWQQIHFIAEHNVELYKKHPELNVQLMSNVFGK